MTTRNISRFLASMFITIAVGSVFLLVLRLSVLPKSFVWRGQPEVRFIKKTKPVCSVDVIRKYCLDRNYFPTGGRWINSSYFPDLCRFPSTDITKERLRGCLTRRNVTKLVVLGDSNGLRYYRATMRLLRRFMTCETLKMEENGVHTPDPEYFTKGTKLKASDIVVHNRDCGGCISTAAKCSDNTIEIYIEYITMEFYVDTEVTTVRTKWQNNCHPSKEAPMCHQSNTNQEFILSEYLESSYPDVILLFSGNHDKMRSGQTKMRGDMEYLKMLIKKYVPMQTKVFWFSKITQFSQQESKSRKVGGISPLNAFLERLNLQLFDVLRTEFVETGGRILPFFDIFDMSLGVPDWALDGIHRRDEWYDVVLSNWMQTFCET